MYNKMHPFWIYSLWAVMNIYTPRTSTIKIKKTLSIPQEASLFLCAHSFTCSQP
jgi:hypothetical protein